MLSKCANPSCSNPFLYLREGKLFRFEMVRPANGNGNGQGPDDTQKLLHRLEYFWLCDSCASQMTIVRSEGGDVRTMPLLALRAAS